MQWAAVTTYLSDILPIVLFKFLFKLPVALDFPLTLPSLIPQLLIFLHLALNRLTYLRFKFLNLSLLFIHFLYSFPLFFINLVL